MGLAALGRDVVYGLGLGVSAPVWGWKLWRTGKWRTDWGGRLGNADNARKTENARNAGNESRSRGWGRVLVHGVSVGEVNLVRGLVAALETEGVEVVVASTTNTGFARAVGLYGEGVKDRSDASLRSASGLNGGDNENTLPGVVRWPLDFSFCVRRFLDAVRPDVVVSAELEVWPNFVEECERRGVPFVVVNGRLSARSFKRYMKVRGLVRRSFARITAAGVQTEAYAERFVALGTPEERVAVLDTMKWDTAKIEPAEAVAGADELARELGIDRGRPLVVAGSTAPGEERLLIEGLRGVMETEGAQLLLAPRKPEWFDEVARVCAGLGVGCVRRTEHTGQPTDEVRRLQERGGEIRVFLLDTIGELRRAYALADVCVVGRSFTGALYGSDPMEPVGLGKPTLIGPWHSDFAEVVAALEKAGGLVVTDDPCGAVRELLHNRAVCDELAAAGVEVIRSRQGSTRKHAEMVLNVLEQKSKRAVEQ